MNLGLRGGCPGLALVLVVGAAVGACSSKSNPAGGRSGLECDPDAGAGEPSLVTNGSFEQPPVPAGGFTAFTKGETFSGWTVVGDAGNVAPLSTSYVSGGFTFPAEDGQQSVDMTGTSQTATGVSQTVATVAGHTYCLSFWVGNISDPGGVYGTTSTINVMVNDMMVAVATNEDEGSTLSWQPFTSTVHASGTSTTIALVNGDPSSDSSNFLDNVTLR